MCRNQFNLLNKMIDKINEALRLDVISVQERERLIRKKRLLIQKRDDAIDEKNGVIL